MTIFTYYTALHRQKREKRHMKNHKYHCCLLFAIRFRFIDMFLHFSRGLNFVDDYIRKILRGFGKKYYIFSSSP